MKRITIILFIIIFINVCSLSANAKSSSSVNFRVLEEGNYVQVIITTSGSENGISGIQGTFNYDKDTLEYVDKKSMANNWMVSGFNAETGIFLLEIDDITDESTYIYEETEIAQFTFKLKEKNITGNTRISISNIIASGADALKEQEVIKNVTLKDSKIESVTEEINSSNKIESGVEKLSLTREQENIVNKTDKTISNQLPKAGENNIKICILLCILISIFFYTKYKKC